MSREAGSVDKKDGPYPIQVGRVVRVRDGAGGDSVIVDVVESLLGYCHILQRPDGAEGLSWMGSVVMGRLEAVLPDRWDLERTLGGLMMTSPTELEQMWRERLEAQWDMTYPPNQPVQPSRAA